MTPDTVLFYQDDCYFKNQPTPYATWFEKGKQDRKLETEFDNNRKEEVTSNFNTIKFRNKKLLVMIITKAVLPVPLGPDNSQR